MIKFVSCCLLALSAHLYSCAQPAVSFSQVATGFLNPVDVVEENAGARRLFVVEQAGTIRIVNGSSAVATPFLNASSTVLYDGGERGLLSLVFHPDYATNGYFFIWYNDKATGDVTLARYMRSTADVANPASGVVLLHIAKRFTNHNGAKLNFGPDGYLYVGTGDGGSGGDPDGNAQDSTTLLAKLLRIDVNNPNPPYYSIPPTNPFAGSTTARPEIIGLGMRNPWRWSFDKETGDMWIADVGQGAWEEVNMVPAANRLNKNFGWNCLEGSHAYTAGCTTPANNVAPVFEYGHNANTGGYSVTGGYVYRGTELPALEGYYLCADYVSNNGWLIKADGQGGFTSTLQKNWASNISGFGEANDGTLYALSRSAGTLFKVVAAGGPLPIHLVSFTGNLSGNMHQLRWAIEGQQAGDVYVVEKRTEATQPFAEIDRRKVLAQSSTNTYNLQVPVTSNKTWYRLQMVGVDGTTKYSSIVSLGNKATSTKAVIISGSLQVTLPPQAKTISIFDVNGKLLLTKPVSNSIAERISLQNIARGILAVRVQTDSGSESVQVLY